MLAKYFSADPRLISDFEEQDERITRVETTTTTNTEATAALTDATFVTLSPNSELPNERVLAFGQGLTGNDAGNQVILSVVGVPVLSNNFNVVLSVDGDTVLSLPLSGILATLAGAEIFTNKTLSAPKLTAIGDYADDTAAAAGGVPISGVYRTASALKVRVT